MWLRHGFPTQTLSARHVARDCLGIAAGLALVAAAAHPLENGLPHDDLVLVLALFAAAAGATAAMLAVLAARLTADQRVGWLSMALGCYSLVAIPTATIGMLDIGPAPAVGAVRFLVHCLVAGLLLTAVIATGPLTGWRVAGGLLATAAAVVGGGWSGTAFPATTQAITTYQPLWLGLGVACLGLGLALVVLAAVRDVRALHRVGLGVAVLGVAHTDQVGTIISPVAGLGLTFSIMQLVGIALVLWGTARLAHEAVDRIDADRSAQEEELRLAEIRLARTAERDHELRNGLAGLAGATNLLGSVRRAPHAAMLGPAVASELTRLDELLRAPVGTRCRRAAATYAVAPVLTGLVALRSSSGMDLRLDVEPGLRVRGSSTLLAQVITNLLGNAARHAPGSPVRISATGDDDQVVIRVRDFGPGVAPGQEHAVFASGIRDDRTVGLGLGLHICRDLLAAENGTISILPSTPGRPGCWVVVRLPAAAAVQARTAGTQARELAAT